MVKFEAKSIPLDQLLLDRENPRFITSPNATQQDIINYLLEYEEIEALAKSINEHRGLYAGERVIVIKEDEHYIVLEGNRRISACKILKNMQLLKNYRPGSTIIVYPETLENISLIDVDILPSRLEAQSALAAKHIDGIKKWSPISKKKFFAKEFRAGKSFYEIQRITGSSPSAIKNGIQEYNLIDYALNLPEWIANESGLIVDMQKLKISPFTRIFNAGSPSLGTILDLQYDTNMQPTSSIPKDIFDHCIYLIAKSSFDKNIAFDTRSDMEDVVGLIHYMKQHDVFSEYFPSEPTASTAATNTNDGPSSTATSPDSGASTPASTSSATETPQNPVPASPATASTQNPSEVPEQSLYTPHPESGSTSKSTPAAPTRPQGTGGKNNLPYFFDGLCFGHLNPQDSLTHGVSRICYELKYFSDKKLVRSCPVSAALLVRAIIEHSLIYYAKTHHVQASTKLIWDYIAPTGTTPILSKIIDQYNKGLANYIPDINIRQYFSSLFSATNGATDPLNWVVHRPQDYVISSEELAALPGRGLLAIINYLIS